MRRTGWALVPALVAALLVGGSGHGQPRAAAAAAPQIPIWAFGDSITAGTWLADPGTQSWPAQLDERLGAGQQVRNLGVGGMAVAYDDCAGCERMDNYVLRQLAAVPAAELPQVVLFAGGINDMIRATDPAPTRTAIYNLAYSVTSRYPAVQFQVMTITPYRSDAAYAEQLSGRRATLNSWERAMYAGSGQLVDTGDILTAGATYGDVRWFVDSLHPDADGAAMIAHGVADVLRERGLA